jgi:hypothetical protein
VLFRRPLLLRALALSDTLGQTRILLDSPKGLFYDNFTYRGLGRISINAASSLTGILGTQWDHYCGALYEVARNTAKVETPRRHLWGSPLCAAQVECVVERLDNQKDTSLCNLPQSCSGGAMD